MPAAPLAASNELRARGSIACGTLGMALGTRPDRTDDGDPRRTAYRILRRFRAHRLRELFPRERPRRGVFTVRDPGELVQIDIKTLGRLTGLPRHSPLGEGRPGRAHRGVTGFQHVHVAIDAASRRSYVEVRSGLGAVDCAAFVRNAVAAFDALGIHVRRVLTDNGAGYKRQFAEACAAEGCVGREPSRTTPGPTVAPSASSARCRWSASTTRIWEATTSVATPSTAGSLSTIATVRTPHSTGSVPSAGYELGA
jgi:hypothetical protein